ncbi:hypothetical protein D9611_006204 [Ephemerocybe angulata]|uniref:MYND-type domain-containing protein n=1 Tax=Ephemerocybe angulata TaxID=980116 RepID=A0A8H5C897_9AGAR|nr:hypothetical protein D9611_006204 [Tulosesus angulatus]
MASQVDSLMNSTGFEFFRMAEEMRHDNEHQFAMELYTVAIIKISKEEDVLQLLPLANRRPESDGPSDLTTETVALAFRNFCGSFRDPKLDITQATSPTAFSFLSMFAPKHEPKPFYLRRYLATPMGTFLLKCLQISAGFTLALLAWDRQDRATAAKRYREALDLAETEAAVFSSPRPGLETWIANDIQETSNNLSAIIKTDNEVEFVSKLLGGGASGLRRGEVPVGHMRKEARAGDSLVLVPGTTIATDACGNCGKRSGGKLRRCTRCGNVKYCGPDCQKQHWKLHKKNCEGDKDIPTT